MFPGQEVENIFLYQNNKKRSKIYTSIPLSIQLILWQFQSYSSIHYHQFRCRVKIRISKAHQIQVIHWLYTKDGQYIPHQPEFFRYDCFCRST